MGNFKRQSNGKIYFYHWIDRKNLFKLSTKLSIEDDKWDAENQRPYNQKLKYKDKIITNELLQLNKDVNEALVRLDYNKQPITIANIKDELNLNCNKSECFKQYMRSILTRYCSCSPQTYTATLNHLDKFKSGTIPFHTFDYRLASKFISYLEDAGKSTNTINTYTKIIRSIFSAALKDGQIKAIPNLPTYKCVVPDNIYLTEPELESLYNLDLSSFKDLSEVVRDYFIIGAYTGLRFSDWHRVQLPLSGNMITLRALKTSVKSIVPIHPNVRAILTKYDNQLFNV